MNLPLNFIQNKIGLCRNRHRLNGTSEFFQRKIAVAIKAKAKVEIIFSCF